MISASMKYSSSPLHDLPSVNNLKPLRQEHITLVCVSVHMC